MTRVVVGAAIVQAGAVLAARRSTPPQLAGRWEFPGGKVEPGEDERAALVRECVEELGIDVAVGELLAESAIRHGLVLRVYVAELGAGEPSAVADHDELRWLSASELDAVDWLEPDRPAVDALRARMNTPPTTSGGG